MANKTNDENWAARERLRAVEVMLWWRGWAGRSDLVEWFGISPAQASSDFQKFLMTHGEGVSYQTSRKRYEAGADFQCLLHVPTLEEAVAVFLGGRIPGAKTGGETAVRSEKLFILELPKREAPVALARRVFNALLAGQRLRVRYHSVNSSAAEWRHLRPGALAWDGRRWHMRAWCEKRQAWRDFALGRISEADWPEPGEGQVPPDEDWNAWEKVVFKINPALKEEARNSIRMDYGLENERMEVPVRRALKGYLLAEMFIDGEGHLALPNHFVIDESEQEK